MAEQTHAAEAPDVRAVIAAAVRQLEADTARLGRALRRLPANADGPSLEVFAALATARRNALTALRKLLALRTDDAARNAAATTLSLVAAALASQYDSLRATVPSVAAREERAARERFAAAGKAFAELDRALGCPYGCKKGA